MAYPTNYPGDLVVPGDLRVTGDITPARDREDILTLCSEEKFPIPWTWWRVWDALHTNLPGTPANDDLALIGGTWASNASSVQAGDLKGEGATTRYASITIPLPWEYEDGETVKLRFHAGMLTTAADNACTLDVVCYEADEERGIGSDLCTTAAQSMNSTAFSDLDFTITSTNLAAGDLLDVRVAIACNDGGTGTAVTPCIGAAHLLCDVR